MDHEPTARPSATTPESSDAVAAALRGAKRNRFRAGMVIGMVVTIAIVLLIVQNGESAQLDWVSFHFKMPLWILVILTAAAGAIVWEVIKVAWRRGRRQRRNQQAALAKAKGIAAA
ncbi:MAG: hypothetical protein ABI706_11475 [Ilumatobacteraceae bacterium]